MGMGKTSLSLVIALFAVRVLIAQDAPTIKAFGSTSLAPPAGATDQDAAGVARFLQWGERMAIHVHIKHLEPGATYEVSMTRKNGDQDESAVLGSITTRTGTIPTPHCFSSHLKEVVPPPAPAGGELDHTWPTWQPKPGGFAVFTLSKDETTLNYDLNVFGTVTEASIVFGSGDPVKLTLDDKLRGSLTITADQLAALADDKAVLNATDTVKDDTGADKTVQLSGEIKACFPWLDSFREWLAAHLSGTGALRLDSKRGDKMPFDVTDLRTLAGATVLVKDKDAVVVLTGVVEALKDFTKPAAPAGGGGEVSNNEADVMSVAGEDFFFSVSEVHDASFVRGDANDDQQIDLSDTVYLLNNLFLDGPAPYCADAADANDSGEVDISDAITMLFSLYGGQGPLPAPSAQRGFDRTVDKLFCNQGN